MGTESLLFIVSNVGLVLIVAAIILARRARRERRSGMRLAELSAAGFTVPPTLHPVIDPTRCISSGSCTRACPQGDDVLGLLSGRATLIDPNVCIGHGRCAAECPTGAIRLVFGTSERGVDIPHLDASFETNVRGVFITGELGGMGLIATAVRQTREAMEHVEARVKAAPAADGVADVAIVGAGPAGLTAALCALDRGLSYRLLDRDETFGGSVLHYPRRKVVLTAPVELPRVGRIHARRMSKEELLELWQGIVDEQGIRVEGGMQVSDVRREGDGTFTVVTPRGEVRARTVMLCVGRRGTPRKLGVPGEETAKVAYALREPSVYDGGREVLVVGGGDSAVEAACTLAEETDSRVTLSYRRAAFSRVKPENLAHVTRLIAGGRIAALMESEVRAIHPHTVEIALADGARTLANDDVLIFAGGELPIPLLERAGVRMEKHFGEETESDRRLRAAQDVFQRIQQQRRSQGLKDHTRAPKATSRFFPLALFATGAVLTFVLFLIGGDYYLTPSELRAHVPELEPLAPTGLWGQTVGVLALGFMITNFTYFVRKEMAFMKGVGSIHHWMSLHVFSGLMSGIVVLFHSALFMRNLFAVALYLSMGIVIATGLVGRYVYAFVPTDPRGRPLAHAALKSLSDRMSLDFGRLFEHVADVAQVRDVLLLEEHHRPSFVAVLGALFIRWPMRWWRMRRLVRHVSRSMDDPSRADELQRFAREMLRLRFQMDYLPQLKRLLGAWRLAHAVLAVLLIFLVSAHVAVEAWVGYRWIF